MPLVKLEMFTSKQNGAANVGDRYFHPHSGVIEYTCTIDYCTRGGENIILIWGVDRLHILYGFTFFLNSFVPKSAGKFD